MQQAAHDYRENPTHPALFQKNSKKVREAQKDLDHKNAYLAKEISLADYLYAQAANIDYIEHIDPDSVEDDDELIPINRNFEELSFENTNHPSNSQLETLTNIENLLIGNDSPNASYAGTSASFIDPPAILDIAEPPSVESCVECGENLVADTYIKCSKCSMFIHYECNEGGVTRYFKIKAPKNFKCYVCKNL